MDKLDALNQMSDKGESVDGVEPPAIESAVGDAPDVVDKTVLLREIMERFNAVKDHLPPAEEMVMRAYCDGQLYVLTRLRDDIHFGMFNVAPTIDRSTNSLRLVPDTHDDVANKVSTERVAAERREIAAKLTDIADEARNDAEEWNRNIRAYITTLRQK